MSDDSRTLISTSPALDALRRAVAQVAPTDATVLVLGETGTGKELVARAVHEQSRRRARAFVPVSCVALAPGLIASELFGHEAGAFTGAGRRRLGRLRAGPRRDTFPRRDRGDDPRDPGDAPAGSPGAGRSTGSAAGPWPSTSGSSRPPTATCRRR